jgi:hypothetical protein
MTKITALEAKTYQGKPSGFKVTFDDGRSGNLQEKESDKGLRVGDDVWVTEIPYTSKAGVKSTLYGVRLHMQSPATQTPPSGPPPQQPTSPKAPIIPAPTGSLLQIKANATVQAMKFVVDAFIADKINWDKIKEYHKEITGYLNDAIDECNQ